MGYEWGWWQPALGGNGRGCAERSGEPWLRSVRRHFTESCIGFVLGRGGDVVGTLR